MFRKIELSMGKCGNWDTEANKLDVRINLRYKRDDSVASAHIFSLELGRKFPNTIFRECV